METAPVRIVPGQTRGKTVRLLLPRPGSALQRMVVNASRYDLIAEEPGSHRFFDRDSIETLPTLGREPLRAAIHVPGTAAGGLSARTHVRGGEADETLVLFDGMPLHEPFHLKDFQSLFSILDSRAVGGIEVYTGGFPARYGDRLSGVMDISSVPGAGAPHHEVSLDLYNAGVLTSGLFAGGRGEYLLNARRGNLDLFLDVVEPGYADPAYFDVVGRIACSPAPDLAITANALLVGDEVSVGGAPEEDEGAEASYRAAHLWMSVDHRIGRRLASETVLGAVSADSDRSGFIAEDDDVTGFVEDHRDYSMLLLRQDWRYSASERLLLRWGADLRRVEGHYDYASEATFADPIAELLDAAPRAFDIVASPDGGSIGLYLSSRMRLGSRFVTDLGLRWDRQNYTIAGGDEQLSPRISVVYRPGPRTRLRAGWGRFHQAQGIHELQVIDGISRFLPAQRSTQTIAGLDYEFDSGMRLRLEAYRKDLDRLRPRYENIFEPIELLPDLQPDRIRIAPQSAVAEGVELLLSGGDDEGPLQWWVSLGRSRAEDRIDGVDVARSWDQRNALGFGLQWHRGRWDASLVGRVHSGWPITDVGVSADGSGLVLGPRNAERLDTFANLDLRVSRRQELPRGALTVFFGLTNLTDRDNPCCVEFDVEGGGEEPLELTRTFSDWLPALPNVGVIWEF